MILRPYQRAALDALFVYWREHAGNPLIVAPTGSGKSVLLATLFRELRAGWPDMRMLAVTHVRELIVQDYQAMLRAWPTAPAGIYSAGLGQRSIGNPITFCGIQSVHKKAEAFGAIDVLAIDEAHLLSRKAGSMYGRFVAALRDINPDMKVVGFTATPYRLDSGRLDRGEGSIFDGIAYDISITRLVEDGFLAPLVSKATELALSVEGVHKRGGEFIESELQKAVDADSVTQAACREIVAYGASRRSWLIFATGVAHAEHVATELRRCGVTAAHVSGEMAAGERDRILGAFKAGRLKAVANANILTTGFDHPSLDLIAMLRPTLSTGLYVQCLGRGMRIAPDKENTLVLDFARNIERHGPVDAVHVKEPGEGTGPAPVKECPDCHSILYAGVRECPDCGYTFPAPDVEDKLQETASAAPVMSRDVQPEWLVVQGWRLARQEKPGGLESVRIEYRCGLSVHREWSCFDHPSGSFPRAKAERWWSQHGGAGPAPGSVLDALKRVHELRPPSEILVRRAGKYWEVASRRFAQREVAA
jgi:DNA repair protein RadD